MTIVQIIINMGKEAVLEVDKVPSSTSGNPRPGKYKELKNSYFLSSWRPSPAIFFITRLYLIMSVFLSQ